MEVAVVQEGGGGGNGGSGIVIIRYLSATANVGIGTTNPLSKLHVYDDATNNTILTVQNNYNTTTMPLPNEIVVTGTTSSTISGTSDRYISFPYTSDSAGLTGQTQYTFATTEALSCDILIIGGGGGGGNGDGSNNEPGGGGAGGIVYMVNKTLQVGTYKVNVAKGGASNQNGFNSSILDNLNNNIYFDNIMLIGYGGGKGATTSSQSGSNGGSGGGGGHNQTNGGLATQGNTFWSGTSYVAGGFNGGRASASSRAGGGGGAGEVGSTDGEGFGGDGRQVSITGTETFYAGGGNGYNNASTTRSDGGGGTLNGGLGVQNGGSALTNTGSGGAGAYGGSGYVGGAGGSGIIIIRYRRITTSASLELIRSGLPNELVVTGATGAAIAGTTDRYISFPYTSDSAGLTGQTQYTFTTTENLNCDILVVGGGGAGGKRHGGGGGAGTLIYHKNITLNGTYTIKVGKGGTGVPSTGFVGGNTVLATSGIFSQFIKSDGSQEYYANGGGRGGGWSNTGSPVITNGGCSAGDSETTLPLTNKFNDVTVSVSNKQYINTLTSPEGCRGNIGGIQITAYKGGGGGGAGGIGMNHDEETTINDGYGGLGLAVDITGTSVVYAGGGNGSDFSGSVSQVFDPVYSTIQSRGGGGFGSDTGTPQNGLNGTGGGGGGQGNDSNGNPSGNGGSGIVIIRYRKVNYNYKIGNYGGEFKIISSTQSADTDYIRITSSGSSIYNPTGSPQWSTTSDRRIKENIEKASYTKCYDSINKLELYRFNYIKELNNINKDLRQLGYIAQEVQEIFPKAVSAEQFYNDNLSIPDLLTIDITQINYSLYGAVKKLMEMYNNKKARLKKLEYLLNIDSDTSNVIDNVTSNIVMDNVTSNIIIDNVTSNVVDTSTSNIVIDNDTSNIVIDSDTSNIIDTSTSNIVIDNSTSNIIDTSTSNIVIDSDTSNI